MKRELEDELPTDQPDDSGQGDNNEAPPTKKHRADDDQESKVMETADEGDCKEMDTVAIKKEDEEGSRIDEDVAEAAAPENPDMMQEPADDKQPADEASKEEPTSDKKEDKNPDPKEDSQAEDVTNVESQDAEKADADAASKEETTIDVHGSNGLQEVHESETLKESADVDVTDKKEATTSVPTDEEGKDSDETPKETENPEGEDAPQETKEEKIGDGNAEAKQSLDTNPPENDTALKKGTNNNSSRSSAGRRLTFPEKLMELLNNEDYRESMSWLPNGNAFALQPTMFTKEILPKHFEGTKFESFTRKLNRWGFKRIAGEDTPEETFAYSHHLFKRDFPELCRGMSGGKKMEQDFTHLIRYRERERMINTTAVAPGSLPNMGYGGMVGASGIGMQQGFVQADLQRMLLERQIAAAGGMAANPYGSFGGGYERELALREMLLRQEAATGQNPNAAFFQQQHFAARFGQPPGPSQMQMNQMQLAQMGSGGQMMMGQGGAMGASQGPIPGSFDAAMMAGGVGGMANGAGGSGSSMSGAPAGPTPSQQQQQNNADLMMMQEQRYRIQQQMAMQNAGDSSSSNPAFASVAGGGGRPFGMQ
jgi:hypothetical protein